MRGAHIGDGFKPDKRKDHDHGVDERAALLPEDVAEVGAVDFYESVISDSNDDDDNEDVKWLREQRLNFRLLKWYERPSVYMVGAFIFLFNVATQLSGTAEFQMTLEGLCRNLGDECSMSLVQAKASTLQNMIEIPASIIRIMVAGKLGKASDIYGRKPILIFTIATTLMGKTCKVVAYNPSFRKFHPFMLIGGDAITSLGGSMFTFLSVANSYVSDVVEENMRSSAMSISVACFYVGFGLGPTIGSWVFLKLLKLTTYETLLVSVTMIILTLVVTMMFLTESRSLKARRKSRTYSQSSRDERRSSINSRKDYYLDKLQDVLNLVSPLKQLWITRYNNDGTLDLAARYNVLKLVAIDFVLCTSTMGLGFIFVLYTSFKFLWTSVMLGYFIGVVMFARALVLFVFAPWWQHFLKKNLVHKEYHLDNIDYYSILLSSFFELLGLSITALAPTSTWFFVGGAVMALSSIATPAIHSAIAKHSNVDTIGELFGALALNRNLVTLMMPVIFQTIYARTVEHHPRIVFYIAVVLVSLAFLAVLTLKIDLGEEDGCESSDQDDELTIGSRRLVRKPSAASIARSEGRQTK